MLPSNDICFQTSSTENGMNGASNMERDRTALIEIKSVAADCSGFFQGSFF
jgi:hypothetical protein